MTARTNHLLCLLGLLLLLTPGMAQQQNLVVNGVNVEGVSSGLLPEGAPATAYAPAPAFAEALGAEYSFDIGRQVATFEMASHLVTLDVFASPDDAAEADTALDRNGQPLSSTGGILMQNQVYVPVKSLAAAFGGSVAYLDWTSTVLVVLPRAELVTVAPPRPGLGYDRIVLSFDALVPIRAQDDVSQNRVTFRFERTDLERARSLRGEHLLDAELSPTGGRVELRLGLEPGSRYEHYTTVNPGGGFSFVVDIFPAPENADLPPAAGTRVVLDPGHGGVDAGLEFAGHGRESELTLDFARRLAALLTNRGIDVQLTRDGDSAIPMERRSSLGAGADLYLSIHAAPMAVDQLKLYYLGDAAQLDSLNMALRENAETAVNSSATDALRRRILLDMVTDLELGERYAQRLAGGLEGLAGYSVSMAGAPLYVLGGAAGRGLLIELGPESFAAGILSTTLADLIDDLVGSD